MCRLITCAKCCSIFSLVGFVFLLVIGALLQNQPKYVKGAHFGAKSAPSVYYAAVIYLGFMIISFLYWGMYEGAVWGMSKINGTGNKPVSAYKTVEMANR